MFRSIQAVCLAFAGAVLSIAAADAQTEPQFPQRATLNYYGLPGLVDMPTAHVMPDGTLSSTISHFSGITRGTLSFQVFPRLTATFRYTGLEGFLPTANTPDPDFIFYDRSFDLHWLAIEQDQWWPSVAIGIRDIAGTGVFAGEYIVATRSFGARQQFEVTAGLGWGRLASRGGFTNPLGVFSDRLETRPDLDVGVGGTVDFDRLFRGDAAFFGGIQWIVNDRLRLQFEYSSDAYIEEVADNVLDDADPGINFGATYRLSRSATLGLHYLYGEAIGVNLTLFTDPSRPTTNTLTDRAPLPVAVRAPSNTPYATDWVSDPSTPDTVRSRLEGFLAPDGLVLRSFHLDADRAVVRVRNERFSYESIALGRVLRAMSQSMPASVEIFEVIFVVQGVDVSRVRIARSDVEDLEVDVDGPELALAAALFEEPLNREDPDAIEVFAETSRFTWGIGPYFEAVTFDPSEPFRADVGVEAFARYGFGNGFVAEGAVRARVFGNLDERELVNEPSQLPPVRTNSFLFDQESEARVEHLTLSHYGRPGRNLYSRISLGWLERQYAGISTELLWQPVNRNYGLGIEINHTWQREFDGGFGVQEDFDVTTGHVSAYFDVTDDYAVQIDAGRYLAGDYGATLRVERVFENGWRVGAFATLTDVPFDVFGEGSFDRGLTLDIPLTWIVGNSTRQVLSGTIRPVLRDGGARLNFDGRLRFHDQITDYQQPRFEETQGVLWR